ncbi:MAG: hypothetical protein ACK40S_10295 [Burkholderiaceae bacterium]
MDNPEQALYGAAKCLISKGKLCAAENLGSTIPHTPRLSRPGLDSSVDNRGQVLYGCAKCLISLGLAPNAQKTGTPQSVRKV